MKKAAIILLGLKNQVSALSAETGQPIWVTKLPGSSMAYDFVTLLSTETQIFAHSKGQLSALDLITGELLWTNNLPGLGYGLASLAIPGGGSAPDTQTIMHLMAQQQSSGAAGSAGTASGT